MKRMVVEREKPATREDPLYSFHMCGLLGYTKWPRVQHFCERLGPMSTNVICLQQICNSMSRMIEFE